MRYLISFWILIGSLDLIGQYESVTVQELKVTQFGYEAGLQSTNVTALFQDSRGTFWVGTRGAGVFQFNKGRFITIPEILPKVSGDVTALCELPDGQLVIQTSSGVFLYDGRRIVLSKNQIPPCIHEITGPSPRNEEKILCELELGMGTWWVGTDKGLRSYSPIDTLWQYYNDAIGLLDDAIQTFTYDHNNVLWIGTRSNGLLQYVGPTSAIADIELTTEVTAVRYNPVTGDVAISCDDGLNYLWSRSDGLTDMAEVDSIRIENFFIDGRGNYWLEGEDDDVRIVKRSDSSDIISTIKLDSRIEAFTYDRFNTVWIETEGGGLYRGNELQGLGQYQLVRSNAVFPGDGIVQLIANGGNKVYPKESHVYRIGLDSVGVVRNDRYEEIYFATTPIRCAHLDNNGVLWLGTVGSGIVVLESGKAPRKLELPAPWHAAKIQFLHKKGSVLWVGTDRAIYQLSLDNTQRSVLRGTRILNLPDAELELQNYVVIGDDAIGVFSAKAVYFLQAQGFTPQANTPRVFVSGVNLRDRTLGDSKYSSTIGAYAKQLKPLTLNYSENTLTFSWHGLNAVPGALTYSYRLNPGDEWSAPSSSTALQFAGLAPGRYLFDLRVCDGKGNCGTLESPWQFEIRNAFWQNWWFWVIVTFLVLSGILFGVKYREKKIRKKAALDLQLIKSKLRAIELEQKAMQLQMNPHFIFNAIQTIHHQLLNNEVNKAANSLVRFSTLMRSMLEMSRTEKVSLEDELEFLNAYVRVEQICRSEPIEFILDVDNNIEPFDTMIPSMMLQPVIENAIKYGGSQIVLRVDSKGKYLQFKVSDNGPGFPDDVLNKDKSVALTLLRERVAHMPGKGFVKYYNIIENGDVTGACVELNIPESNQSI